MRKAMTTRKVVKMRKRIVAVYQRCPFCGYCGNFPDSGECPSCGEVS